MTRIRNWFRSLPAWVRAALTTAGQSAVGAALMFVIVAMAELTSWAQTGDAIDLRPGLVELIGAVNAALAGFVAALHRRVVPPAQSYPDERA